jgi:outer membrane biosynthesis protein TonB
MKTKLLLHLVFLLALGFHVTGQDPDPTPPPTKEPDPPTPQPTNEPTPAPVATDSPTKEPTKVPVTPLPTPGVSKEFVVLYCLVLFFVLFSH